MFLKAVTHGQITEFRGVVVPAHGMAAGPVARRGRANIEGHADTLAGIESGSAYPGQFPTWAQVTGPPFRISLESTTGQDYRVSTNIMHAAVLPHGDAPDHRTIVDQLQGPGAVSKFNSRIRAVESGGRRHYFGGICCI